MEIRLLDGRFKNNIIKYEIMIIKKIELTEQEAQVLINLINVSVMAKGLEVAESALYLSNKINVAFAPVNKNIKK